MLNSNAGAASEYAARAVPQLDDNILWIEQADAHRLVVGSQARILYANAAARARIAKAFNDAVADGRLTRCVVVVCMRVLCVCEGRVEERRAGSAGGCA